VSLVHLQEAVLNDHREHILEFFPRLNVLGVDRGHKEVLLIDEKSLGVSLDWHWDQEGLVKLCREEATLARLRADVKKLAQEFILDSEGMPLNLAGPKVDIRPFIIGVR
jgi:hypothetical protein